MVGTNLHHKHLPKLRITPKKYRFCHPVPAPATLSTLSLQAGSLRSAQLWGREGRKGFSAPWEHSPPALVTCARCHLCCGKRGPLSLRIYGRDVELGRGREGRQPPHCHSSCTTRRGRSGWSVLLSPGAGWPAQLLVSRGWRAPAVPCSRARAPTGEGAAPAGGCLPFAPWLLAKRGLELQTNSRTLPPGHLRGERERWVGGHCSLGMEATLCQQPQQQCQCWAGAGRA